jgi:hypothetical protein
MSKPYLKLVNDAGEQFLTSLAEGQETFLKSLAAMSAPPPAAPPMPFATSLPTVAEVTEANFSFTQKLLKQQKEFVEKLLAATTPATH